MTQPTITLELAATDTIAADDLDQLTRSLQNELLELPESITLSPGQPTSNPIPPGAKAAEVLALGAITIAVLPKTLPPIIDFLKEWLLRPGNRPVKIKISNDATDIEFDPRIISPDEVKKLVAELQAK